MARESLPNRIGGTKVSGIRFCGDSMADRNPLELPRHGWYQYDVYFCARVSGSGALQ